MTDDDRPAVVRTLDIDPRRDGPPPRPAATVVLLRDVGSAFEVFLVRRTPGAAFMAGAHVFPGGKLDDSDASPELLEHVDGLTLASAATHLGGDLDPAVAMALHVAAIRETFEESGVLLGATGPGVSLPALRRALLSGTPFLLAMRDARAVLDAAALVPYARWITPAVEKRRFDARFFLARAPDGMVASHDAGETVAGAWVTPRHAVAAHLDGRLELPPPTLRTLEALSAFRSVDEACDDARRRPPPVIRPVFKDLEGRWVLALPGDPEHPERAQIIAGPTRFTRRPDGRFVSG